MSAIIPDDERTSDDFLVTEPITDLRDPVVALLDGLPLQNHRRLLGYLIIDDPDDLGSKYIARERKHGTAMASLILHGDLDGNENPLSRKLYVRPILQPNQKGWRRYEETAPENALVLDLIHRAVSRIFDGDGSENAAAPTVCVINLAIGIKDRLFEDELSPLARLLDWLSWQYQVLFIVSVGNHYHPIKLNIARDNFLWLSAQEIQELLIRSIALDNRNRRLLSPAEAINVLTVGSLHEDQSDYANIPRAVYPYIDRRLPSPINAQGMGYRRSIKPEIFAPGGRIVLWESIAPNPNMVLEIRDSNQAPGQKVAAPGLMPGDPSAAWYTRGTSNATALTSRAAAFLYDVLNELRSEPGGELIDNVPHAVWLKALLTHSAGWGTAGDILNRILLSQENRRKFKEYLTRFLGYGEIDVNRVKECTEQRVTALSGGTLRKDQTHIHQFPLPPSLAGQICWRRLTITLAWMNPVNPRHQGWRRAALWFEPLKQFLRVDRQQADWRAVKRGTIQHEVLEGEQAGVFVDGDNVEIIVNCSANAGTLEEIVPYALVTTLEVREDIDIPLYEEVRVRVHAARVRVTPSE